MDWKQASFELAVRYSREGCCRYCSPERKAKHMISDDRCLCYECKCRHCGWRESLDYVNPKTGRLAGKCTYVLEEEKEHFEEGKDLRSYVKDEPADKQPRLEDYF